MRALLLVPRTDSALVEGVGGRGPRALDWARAVLGLFAGGAMELGGFGWLNSTAVIDGR